MKIVELGIDIMYEDNKDVYKFVIYDRDIFSENYINYYKKLSNDYDAILKGISYLNEEEANKYLLDSILNAYDASEDTCLTINKFEYEKLLKIIRKSKMKKLKLV